MDRLLEQAEDSLRVGDHVRAEALCREVLTCAPGNPIALRILGILALERRHADEAIPLLRDALQAEPTNPNTLDALAVAYAGVGDFAQAEDIARRGLAIDSSRPVAHLRLGMMLTPQGKWDDAVRAFEDAIARAPRLAEAHHNLGDALTKLHRLEEAIASFQRALAIDPGNPETHNSLGTVLRKLGRNDEAVACYDRALALDPNYALALMNRGNSLMELGEMDQGRRCLERATRLMPDSATAHCNLGLVLLHLGKWSIALKHFEYALRLDPGYVDARYNLGLVKLFRHEFEEGWLGYDYRLECTEADPRLANLYKRQARWRGLEDLGAGEVAIRAEQGIGDRILFSTLIPELIGTQLPFIYEVDRRLLNAYERAFPDVRFVALDDPPHHALQEAERVLLAGSLPRIFRRSRGDFARQPVKLLSALPERIAHYRQRIDALGPGLKVALSWRSTRKDWWVQRNKSAPLTEFAPLLKLPDTRFVDVQYGDTAAERRAVEAAAGVRIARFPEVDHFNDIEEVLAILEACDLLITTSNVTAHFAGALGKRTWLLYPGNQPPFHYWAGDENHRALWYPTVEILTAVEHADWRALIEAAAARLGKRVLDVHAEAARVAVSAAVDTSSPASLELARAMRTEGRFTEAAAVCRRVLERVPRDAEAWCELSHALRWEDQFDDARDAATRAIEIAPELPAAWFNLGAIQVAQGEAASGTESYRRALELDPDFAEAWSNLGGALAAGGDKAGEMDAYRRALDINPGLGPVWSNLGNVLREAGRFREAAAASRRAVGLDPDLAAAWINLGSALLECGENEEAVRACDSAVRLAPGLAEGWSALGGALHAMRRYDEAVRAHQRAIEIRPASADLHFNLGMTLQHCGRNAEAIPSLRRALEFEPDHADAHFELSLALLITGYLPEGWDEYEWRWRRPGVEPWRYDLALWGGNPSKPCRLLVWGEQGIGDQILYGSMIAELASSPLTLTLEVDRRLAAIYQRSFPRVVLVPRQAPPAANPAAHDCQVPMASLGRWLRPSFESFPRRAFLKPDPSRVDEYRRRLAGGQAAVVGVSWRSANREFGSFKSTGLGDWVEILKVPHARFVDLQYGDTAGERESLERETGARIEHLPDLDLTEDLDGLAALCAACDLVVTVSNVTAHVAGAVGRPVWLIAPKGNGRFWYWFAGRSDSPWYPSVRIFDQVFPGSWRETLDAVARELAAFAGRR